MRCREWITVCIPTRGRVDKLDFLVDSIIDNACGDTEFNIMFYVDIDDRDSIDWCQSRMMVDQQLIRYIVGDGERKPICEMHNIMARQCCGDIIVAASDDLLFRSEWWCDAIREEISNWYKQIVVIQPNDLHNVGVVAHPIVHRAWIDLFGFLIPPVFKSWFADNWITDVCKQADVHIYMEDLIFEHMHPNAGKSKIDETYIYRAALHQDSQQAYEDQKKSGAIAQAVAKIRAFLDE